MKKILFALAATALVGLAHGQLVEDFNSTTLNPNDVIDFSQQGITPYALLSSGTSLTSDGGLGATLTFSSTTASPYIGVQDNADLVQPPVGTSVLQSNAAGPLKLTFASPVAGVGAFISADAAGTVYTAKIDLYNMSGNVFDSFTEAGVTSASGTLGTAIFIGAHDVLGTEDIYGVRFSLTSGTEPQSFVVGPVNLDVPEPTTYALLAAGLVIVILSMRRRPV